MRKYVKEYLHRGLIFGGFGPIVVGIIFLCVQLSGTPVHSSGKESFVAIVSTYLLAFIHAGSSVFNQIEEWSIAKSTGMHFLSLYFAYVVCYLLNRWIPFSWEVIVVFTGIFAVGYLAVWLTVYCIVRKTSKKLNEKLGGQK